MSDWNSDPGTSAEVGSFGDGLGGGTFRGRFGGKSFPILDRPYMPDSDSREGGAEAAGETAAPGTGATRARAEQDVTGDMEGGAGR